MSLTKNFLLGARRFKPAWMAFNLAHWRGLRGNSEHYRRFGIKRTVLGSIAHRDISNPSDQIPWLDRPDAGGSLAQADLSPFPGEVREKLRGWPEDGMVVLDGFYSEDRVEEMREDLRRQMDAGTVDFHYRGNRVPDSYKHSEVIRGALNDPLLLGVLAFLLGREVRLFQTINFFEGSEQAAHSDSFHMTTEPVGYLIAIWVALEDVDADSGPVFYYPGSHRLPYVMTEDLDETKPSKVIVQDKGPAYERKIAEIAAETGIEPVDFLPRKGDVLIWHANLLHGGRAIERPGATRESLVAHFFGEGVLCYHEATERPALIEA